MKIIALLVSILLCHFSYGQFAIVADNDGYVNVRVDTGLGSKITDTLHKGALQLVNGKGYLGTDGEVPKRTYKSIIVTIGSKIIELPRAAYEDLFEPSLHHTEVHYLRQKDIIYITASNSDGAGF